MRRARMTIPVVAALVLAGAPPSLGGAAQDVTGYEPVGQYGAPPSVIMVQETNSDPQADGYQVAGGPPPWAPAHGYRRKHKNKHGHEQTYDYEYYDGYGPPLNLDMGRCNRDVIGQILGGAAGAAAGSQIGDGKGRIAAIIGGSIVGILIGGEIGRSMDQADVMCTDQVLEYAPDGRTVTWNGEGGQYAVTPAETYQTNSGIYCREYQVSSTVGREVVETYGTACRQPDGSWRLMN